LSKNHPGEIPSYCSFIKHYFEKILSNVFVDGDASTLKRCIIKIRCDNSPAAIARELFKPSTDAASLHGSIKKKFF